MSRQGRPAKNPQAVVGDELTILNLIESRKDVGIWNRSIKYETKLPDVVVNKSIKSLLAKSLIKEVKNINSRSGKHYMAVGYEPSKEISGGDFYSDGKLDIEFVNVLKEFCIRQLKKWKVATVEGVHNELKKQRLVTFDISSEQVAKILYMMELDNDVIEEKSTGLGEYQSIPEGKTCYRVVRADVAKAVKTGIFSSIPCGACTLTDSCSPNGKISPKTCVYYNNWLKIEF